MMVPRSAHAPAGAVMDPPRQIFVIDDDREVRALVSRRLVAAGYRVREAMDGPEAMEVLTTFEPDLVVLDLVLPSADGLDLLATLRRSSDVPVIVISARDEEADRVVGLELGADDYLVKPFSSRELLARVRSVLRRANVATSADVLTFEGLRIDRRTREVQLDGRTLETTGKEFDLLAFLAASPRQVFSREQLIEAVWNSMPEWLGTATVTEHVHRLRRKMDAAGSRRPWIVTVRGVGYRFEG